MYHKKDLGCSGNVPIYHDINLLFILYVYYCTSMDLTKKTFITINRWNFVRRSEKASLKEKTYLDDDSKYVDYVSCINT